MKNFWIKVGLTGFFVSLLIALGLGFGFKDKIYLKANFDISKKQIILSKENYELIKKKKKLEVKINNKNYQININSVNNLNNFFILKTNLKLDKKEKLIDVLIFYKTQPIIKSMIDNFKIN